MGGPFGISWIVFMTTVDPAEPVHGSNVSILRRFAIPNDGTIPILCYAFATTIHVTNVELCGIMAAPGGLAIPR